MELYRNKKIKQEPEEKIEEDSLNSLCFSKKPNIFLVPCEDTVILSVEEMKFVENLHESVEKLKRYEAALKLIKNVLGEGTILFIYCQKNCLGLIEGTGFLNLVQKFVTVYALTCKGIKYYFLKTSFFSYAK